MIFLQHINNEMSDDELVKLFYIYIELTDEFNNYILVSIQMTVEQCTNYCYFNI